MCNSLVLTQLLLCNLVFFMFLSKPCLIQQTVSQIKSCLSFQSPQTRNKKIPAP